MGEARVSSGPRSDDAMSEKPEGDVARWAHDFRAFADGNGTRLNVTECIEVADLLESQSHRIAELENALRAVLAADRRVTDFGVEGALRLCDSLLSTIPRDSDTQQENKNG